MKNRRLSEKEKRRFAENYRYYTNKDLAMLWDFDVDHVKYLGKKLKLRKAKSLVIANNRLAAAIRRKKERESLCPPPPKGKGGLPE